jgi:MoaA/NifB/PqqE/SkfB family radical SAM enzyme
MLKSLGIACKYTVARFWTHRPFILTHSVTSACNCRCKICNIWKKPRTQELSTTEVSRMLDEAYKMKFVAYLMWGGEPLMRTDTIEILRCAHKLGFYTSIITNGTLLEENAAAIAKNVDLTWVSLDYDSEYHSEMRGVPGVFGKAMKGIQALKRAHGRVVANCVLSKLNVDAVHKLGTLADQNGLKLAFDPMEVFPGSNDKYALSIGQREEIFSQVADLKKRGYPILNSFEYARNQAKLSYWCAQPRIFLNVSEEGKVSPFWCRKSSKTLGDLRKQSLNEIVSSSAFSEFAATSNGCSLCSHSTAFETSIFYSAKRFLANVYSPRSPYLRFLADFVFT